MTILQATVLGLVQGVTEFLPISSSGHLILFPEIFGWEMHGYDFDVMIHLATLLAIVIVLRKDILNIGKLGWKIVVATIPVVIFGLVISNYMDSVRLLQIIAINLMVWGAVLWVADWYSARIKKGKRVNDVKKISWTQAIVIGLVQMVALIPGSSRSGVTISAGLFGNLDRATAARFSFLLAIPAIAGAGVMAGLDVYANGLSTPISALIIGFLSAFLSGAVAIKFLFEFLKVADYKWFAVYRILLGLVLLFFLV